ncbi:RNA-directed DNA polymerase [Tanacetum coccineum]
MCKEAALSKELRDLSFCSAVPIPGYYKNNRKRDCKRKYWKDCYGTAVFQVLIYQMNGFLSLLILVNIICCIFNISEEKENSKLVSGYLIWGEKEGIHVYGSMTEDYEDLWEQELKEEKEKVKELQELRNDQERRISWVHEENLRLKQQQDRGNEQLAREFEQKIKEARKEERRILEDKITQLEEKVRKYEEERFEWEFPPLERNPSMLLALEELTAEPQIKSHMANVVLETEVVRNAAEDQDAAKPKVRKVVNHLYNVTVEFDIPNCPFFKTKAIIDTGASSCFINKEVVPKEALELLTYSINVNGLNSKQPAEHKVKAGTFSIEGNKFRIPLIYAFDMKINDGIQMLIGTNFLRAMQGGIRIEGDEITIYKKVTKFKTR